MLPLLDPAFNIREVVKQLILLEDHLNHPEKQCDDCIGKHLLTAEALAEEAVSLEGGGGRTPVLLRLCEALRGLSRARLDGVEPSVIAADARDLRKSLAPVAMTVRVASQRQAAYFNVGDTVFFGKYKNKAGIIVGFGKDERGIPMVEIEPVPKGRRMNRVFGLYKIWHSDLAKRIASQYMSSSMHPVRIFKGLSTHEDPFDLALLIMNNFVDWRDYSLAWWDHECDGIGLELGQVHDDEKIPSEDEAKIADRIAAQTADRRDDRVFVWEGRQKAERAAKAIIAAILEHRRSRTASTFVIPEIPTDTPDGRFAARFVESFNKENAPELLSQLIRVLNKDGLTDAVNAIKRCRLTEIVEGAWSTTRPGRGVQG